MSVRVCVCEEEKEKVRKIDQSFVYFIHREIKPFTYLEDPSQEELCLSYLLISYHLRDKERESKREKEYISERERKRLYISERE